jgi:hypothetical protein
MTRFLAACAITFGAITIAQAQDKPICAERQMIKRIMLKYGETPRSAGMVNGVLMEIYASDAGTWSLVFTDSTGESCVARVGTDYVDGVTVAGKQT